MKRAFQLGLPALLLFAMICCFPQKAFAKDPVKFPGPEEESFVFNDREDEDDAMFYSNGYMAENAADIVDWESTNEKVATASIDTSTMTINPVGVGECDVSAIDEDGNKATIHVIVKKSYIIDKLKYMTSVSNVWYGTKKIYISSSLGATGKVVIGKKTYKFNIPKKGEEDYYSFAETSVKLKKVFKLNTKGKVYVTVKSNGVKCTYTEKIKLSSGTWVPKASGKKKKLTLTVSNPHKGDVVKVTYKGKTVSKKIKKDKDGKELKVTLKLKKNLKKNSSFKVVVLNKDKKVLDKETIKLENYKYEYVDPEEDTGSDEDYYEE